MKKEQPQISDFKRLVKETWGVSRKFPLLSFTVLAFILCAQSLSFVSSFALGRLTDSLIQGVPPQSSFWHLFFWYILPVPGVLLLTNIFWRSSGFVCLRLVPKIAHELRERAFNGILKHSYRFFSDHFAGSLVTRARSLESSCIELLDVLWWNFLPLVVSFTGSTIILAQTSPLLGAACLVWSLVIVVSNVFVSRIKMPYDQKRAAKKTLYTGQLSDAMTNALAIKLFNAHEEEAARILQTSSELNILHRQTWWIKEMSELIQIIINFGLSCLIFVVMLQLWMGGNVTVGDFTFVITVLLTLFHNTHGMAQTLRRVYESSADAKEILDILDLQPDVRDKRGAKDLRLTKGLVEFKNVVFKYNDSAVLNNFSLRIAPEEKIALVGSSGAGKTTVTKLLFRFFDVQAGKILVDGQDIAGITQESLRKAVALVPQEPALFHRSLLENIRYGRREATDNEVVQAAKLAHCHEFISSLPNGYATLVGERGVKLSGGERQRVAIARAIIKNAPILVLDEATSSLDSESESLIQDALRQLMKDKTVIVIAHRLSTIMQMDRIIVMENGKVTDTGTHADLVNKEGIYQKLWNIQAGGFREQEEE